MVAPAKGEIYIHLPRGWMKDFLDYIKTLNKGDLKRVQGAAMYKLACKARDLVKKGYQYSAYAHAQGTEEAYSHGKRAGLRPARRRWSAKSLQRSGTLMRSVVVRRSKHGYEVKIDPKKTYSGQGDPADAARGLRLQRIAAQMEDPKPIIVEVTHAMAAYLALIRGKGGQPGTATVHVGQTITIEMKPKKVWEPVYNRIKSIMPIYNKELRKHLRKRGGRRFPGIVLR